MTYILPESNLIYYHYILFSIGISYLLSHFWLGIVALKYYNTIKSANIEPWIKKRYQIIGLGSLIYGFSILIYYFIPYDVIDISSYPNIIYSYLILSFTIFYSLCMYFAWIMPKWLKKLFNKEFQEFLEKEFEENELLELIKKELSERTQ